MRRSLSLVWVRAAFLLLAASLHPGRAVAAEKECPAQKSLPVTGAREATASLRRAAQRSGLIIGTAMRFSPAEAIEQYWRVAAREFSGATPENAMKWEFIHPQRDLYDFCVADAVVRFAQEQGMKVRGHTLIWNQQLPAWMTGGKFSREEMIEIMHEHITTVMRHYRRLFPGVVTQWDVVNEGIGSCAGPQACGMEGGFWLSRIGPDYIPLAFKFAREADPDALLYYNDIGFEYGPQHAMHFAKRMGVFNLLRWLLRSKVPIDGVGVQLHVDASPAHRDVPEASELEDVMNDIADLGLDVAITELDVGLGTASPSALQQGVQAEIYTRTLDACLAQPRCHTFFMWGYTDLVTWRTPDAVCIFDRNYQPKLAYVALRNRLAAVDGSVGEINSRDANAMRQFNRDGNKSAAVTEDASFDRRRLRSTGAHVRYPVSAHIPGTFAGALVARGFFAGGAWPQVEIQLDGIHVADLTVNSAAWSTYEFPLTLPVGEHVVQATFSNDFYQPPEDRDVEIARLSVATEPLAGWRRLAAPGDGLDDEIALGGGDHYMLTVLARSASKDAVALQVHWDDMAVAKIDIDSMQWRPYRVPLRVKPGAHRLAVIRTSAGAAADVYKVSVATEEFGRMTSSAGESPRSLPAPANTSLNASVTVTTAARYLFLVSAYRDTPSTSGMLNITVDGRPVASGEVGDTEWTTARIIASLPAGTHDIGVVAPRGNVHLREFRIEPVASDD